MWMFVVITSGAAVRSGARARSEALLALGVQGLQAQDRHGRQKEGGHAPGEAATEEGITVIQST